MANTYGRLGALRPANTTDAQLYLVGTDINAMVVVFCCNQTGTAVDVRVAHLDSGSTAANEDWLCYDKEVPANDFVKVGPISMTDGESIRVRTATADAVSFIAEGIET